MKRKSLIIISMVVLLVLLGSCYQNPKADAHTYTLTITLIDAQGRMVADGQVYITGPEGKAKDQPTDTFGEARFELPAGTYHVQAKDRIFHASQSIRLTGSETLTVRLEEVHTPGMIALIRRNGPQGLQSYLAADPDLFAGRMILHGGDWEKQPPLMEVSHHEGYWVWIPQVTEAREVLVRKAPVIHALQTFNPQGQVLIENGHFPESDQSHQIHARSTYGQDALRKVGDLSKDLGAEGYDGKINVWDLIFLLQRYGTQDPAADIGRMGSDVHVPPSKPFWTNVPPDGQYGPDGQVDVWDLILLLKAYGATIDTINSPLRPQVTEDHFHGTQVQIQWEAPHPDDILQSYVIFETDTDPLIQTHIPLYSQKIHEVGKDEREATVSTTRNYLLLYAYTPGGENRYFSPPAVIRRLEEWYKEAEIYVNNLDLIFYDDYHLIIHVQEEAELTHLTFQTEKGATNPDRADVEEGKARVDKLRVPVGAEQLIVEAWNGEDKVGQQVELGLEGRHAFKVPEPWKPIDYSRLFNYLEFEATLEVPGSDTTQIRLTVEGEPKTFPVVNNKAEIEGFLTDFDATLIRIEALDANEEPIGAPYEMEIDRSELPD